MQVLILLCLKIFCCRIIDVSLATIRTIVTVKGKNVLACIIAFFEGMIWFLVVREALLFDNIEYKIYIAIAYAAGFAMGTLIGGILAQKIVKGVIGVQVVTSSKNEEMLDKIRENGYAITVIDIAPSKYSGAKYMILCETSNSKLSHFKKLIHSLDENAFIMVNETKYVYNGYFKH